MAVIRVADYLDDYIASRQDLGQASNTVQEKRRTVTKFAAYCRRNDIVLDTDEPYEAVDAVRDFFLDNEELTVSVSRISHIRDLLQYIQAHLGSRDQDKLQSICDNIRKNRFPPEAFQTDVDEPVYLEDDAIRRACREASDRAELVIRYLFDTGCRINEMRAVRPSDIDFRHPDVGAAVQVERKLTREGRIEPPKNDSKRTVELTYNTAYLVRKHIKRNSIDADDEVFPMSVRTYETDVKAAFTAAGVCIEEDSGKSHVTPHWLRHQRNSRIRKEYGKEAAVQYLGHRPSDDVNDTYTHYSEEEVQCVVGDRDGFALMAKSGRKR